MVHIGHVIRCSCSGRDVFHDWRVRKERNEKRKGREGGDEERKGKKGRYEKREGREGIKENGKKRKRKLKARIE